MLVHVHTLRDERKGDVGRCGYWLVHVPTSWRGISVVKFLEDIVSLSIEYISAKAKAVKVKRESLQDKITSLEKCLADALEGLSLYARSKSITLEHTGPDDWIYGHLSYHNGVINVIYRSTEDEYTDAMDDIPEEYQTHNIKHIAACDDDWIEKLSQREVINSILASVDRNLNQMLEVGDSSLKSLESALDSQSNTLATDSQKTLKEIGDSGLLRAWTTARRAIHLDPADSITRSSSYIESVCRKILAEQSQPLPNKKEIASLINECTKLLDLSSDKEAQNDLRQIVGGLKGVVQGIGTLRTHFGTAHGSSPEDYEVDEHYARFVNNAAAAVGVFLLQRHESKLNKQNQSDA